jgi:hypothetical protein
MWVKLFSTYCPGISSPTFLGYATEGNAIE